MLRSQRDDTQLVLAHVTTRLDETGVNINVRYSGQPFGLILKGAEVDRVQLGSVASLVARRGDVVLSLDGRVVQPTAAGGLSLVRVLS